MIEPDKNHWKCIAKEFYDKWNYPHCVGALDGKHVQIRCPYKAGSSYYNYKGTHSIVLLAMVDAYSKFTLVDVGAYGRNSDGGTQQRSTFGKKLLTNQLHIPKEDELTVLTGQSFPYVVVADEAFPLKTWMMRPYSRNSIVSEHEKIYNYRHSRARRTVENAFGILAGRWRIFLKPIETQPESADYIVLSACCLHNMLRKNKVITPFEKEIMVPEEEICGLEDLTPIRRNYIRDAIQTREKFKNFFISPEGTASCPWQWDYIRLGRISH